jgi:hypothetical protein
MWDREVYVQMKRITGEEGTCYASRATLAKQCGMSVRRLDKSIQYLIDHKWIALIGKKEMQSRGGVQIVNEYEISDLWKINVDYYENTKGGAHGAYPIPKVVQEVQGGVCTDEGKGGAHGAYKEEPLKKNPRKEDSAIAVGNEVNGIIKLFKPLNPSFAIIFKNTNERAAIERMLKSIGLEKLRGSIEFAAVSNGMPYAPTVTTPLELERNLGKLIAFYNKENGKVNKLTSKIAWMPTE